MKYIIFFVFCFALAVQVKCQQGVHIDELLYEEYEEDDEQTPTTSTTVRSRLTRSTVATQKPSTIMPMLAINLTETPGPTRNSSFTSTPVNGSIFGSVVSSNVRPGASTERVHYVLNQVGNIWNNVGALNISGIVDSALGIRNSQFARPLVTGIINAVLCNPITFSENNCRKSG